MARLFISYSRVDRPFTEQLVRQLRRAYDHVWFDESIHGGYEWWQEILDQIAACDIFVYLLSNDSVDSAYCQAELAEARRLHKQILPVVIRARTHVPDDLSHIHYVDMSRGLTLDNFAELQAAIIRLMSRISAIPAAPLSENPPPVPAVTHASRQQVTPMPQAVPKQSRARRGQQSYLVGVGIIAAVLIAVLIIAFALNVFDGSDDNSSSGDATDEASRETEMASVPTPSTATLDIVAIVATLDAQATAAVRATEFAATATQSAVFAGLTETAILNATETATLWTATPTIDMTASIDAYTTQRAIEATETEIASWTDTPTPSDTPTATLTPTAIPLGFPGNPVTSNAQWQPVTQIFDGVEMVLVPAGCFMMGSDDGEEDEKPARQQCFAEPFWIDKYEVTNAQFEQFNGQAGSESNWTDPNRPRERITWFEARDFCELRGGRLPTEKEWEYAARGPDSLVYPWGDEFVGENAVYFGSSDTGTADVGSRPDGKSWIGSLDMGGNVWEWTSTIYQDYPYDTTDRRESRSDSISARVLRGGSFFHYDSNIRAANRLRSNPSIVLNYNGFRCARDY